MTDIKTSPLVVQDEIERLKKRLAAAIEDLTKLATKPVTPCRIMALCTERKLNEEKN